MRNSADRASKIKLIGGQTKNYAIQTRTFRVHFKILFNCQLGCSSLGGWRVQFVGIRIVGLQISSNLFEMSRTKKLLLNLSRGYVVSRRMLVSLKLGFSWLVTVNQVPKKLNSL